MCYPQDYGWISFSRNWCFSFRNSSNENVQCQTWKPHSFNISYRNMIYWSIDSFFHTVLNYIKLRWFGSHIEISTCCCFYNIYQFLWSSPGIIEKKIRNENRIFFCLKMSILQLSMLNRCINHSFIHLLFTISFRKIISL